MEITIKAGTYTDVLGETYTLDTDKVIALTDGTDNFVALIYNPDTGVVDIWHTTELPHTDPVTGEELPKPPEGFKVVQVLIGWGWFIIPAGTTDITDIPLYCFTWIDNIIEARTVIERDPLTYQPIKRIRFYGKGEESGMEYEIEEIEHFIADELGTYFYCPNEGAVTRGRPCKVCGNMDVVRIKVRK